MESVNETPMKRKRGRPRKVCQPLSLQMQSQPNEDIKKLLDEYQKTICNHLSDILIDVVHKIEQVKSLTKEINRENLIKDIVRNELQKIFKNEASEIELVKKELMEMKDKYDTLYESIHRCQETSTEF